VGQGKVNLSLKFRGFLQVLLISALMIAPAWGQIHKIIHGPSVLHNLGHDHDHHHETEHVLFSDHEEGSLLCLALDHLASGEGLQTLCTSVAIVEANPLYFSVESESVFSERLLAFSARAPPASL
jgi:hypothetical protein